MTSNQEAKAMGYVDRVHYKYYPLMSAEEYLEFRRTGKCKEKTWWDELRGWGLI